MATRQQSIKVRYGLFVQAPPDEVAEFVENVDRYPEWQSSLFEIKDKSDVDRSGRLSRNAKVRDSRNILGKKIDSRYGVTEHEEGKSIALEIDEGDVYWTMRFSYEPMDGGTWLTAEGGGDLGAVRAGKAAAQKSCLHMLEGDLGTLRTLVETKNGG